MTLPKKPLPKNTLPFGKKIANPYFFMAFTSKLLPYIYVLTIALLVIGGLFILNSPNDYQQGITVRIMYLHVPFAWLSLFCYSLMTISAFGTLVWRHILADIALKTAAPLGATFTALALITGSLWGRPTWGTWWEWDARLTSVLVLFFIYLAIIALGQAFDDKNKAAKSAALLTIIGFINIPIIKFSVDWWNTLHQPASILRKGGSAIDSSMLTPLLIMAIGFSCFFFVLHILSMRTEIFRQQIITLQSKLARQKTIRDKK